jgi:hypothetical protein
MTDDRKPHSKFNEQYTNQINHVLDRAGYEANLPPTGNGNKIFLKSLPFNLHETLTIATGVVNCCCW